MHGIYPLDLIEDTGEPFLIRSEYDEMHMNVCNSANVEYTLCKVENVVHTIDPKYVRSGYDMVIHDNDQNHTESIVSGNYDDLINAFVNMRQPKVLLITTYSTEGAPMRAMYEAEVIETAWDWDEDTPYTYEGTRYPVYISGNIHGGYEQQAHRYFITVYSDNTLEYRVWNT